MFNKDLFLSLCEKYNVELSETASSPMIREGEQTHVITKNDMDRIFTPYRTFFGYSNNKINANIKNSTFYLQEEYAIAC